MKLPLLTLLSIPLGFTSLPTCSHNNQIRPGSYSVRLIYNKDSCSFSPPGKGFDDEWVLQPVGKGFWKLSTSGGSGMSMYGFEIHEEGKPRKLLFTRPPQGNSAINSFDITLRMAEDGGFTGQSVQKLIIHRKICAFFWDVTGRFKENLDSDL